MTARLIAISDRRVAGQELTLERFRELARLARPGSVVLQLRDLELPARERLSFGARLLEVARESGQLFVVNDRVDLAVLLGADGVHLGEAAIETEEARRLFGRAAFVSRACHDISRVAVLDADAVLLSPVAQARKGREALGFDALRRARQLLGTETRPALFALGGITAENARACRDAGADGVAMIGGVFAPGALERLVRALDLAR